MIGPNDTVVNTEDISKLLLRGVFTHNTRRSARALILDVHHHDIFRFVGWKLSEEHKVKSLIAAGYDADFNGEAYKTISGQNGNNSVSVSYDFMRAVKNNEKFSTWWSRDVAKVTDVHGNIDFDKLKAEYKPSNIFDAKMLWRKIAEAAYACADPGLQYNDVMNSWNTLAEDGKIEGSNPCSEHMSINDTACNLMSINVTKFYNKKDSFDVKKFKHVITLSQLVLDITNSMAHLPSQEIAKNVWQYRQTGLGFANLGSLCMMMGVPYDSNEAVIIAGALTGILGGHSYVVSALLAQELGPYPAWERNSKHHLKVVRNHRRAAYGLNLKNGKNITDKRLGPNDKYEGLTVEPFVYTDVECCDQVIGSRPLIKTLVEQNKNVWDEALSYGCSFGYRNSSMTLMAPTGTIAFVMDCDSTGIEPAYALVTYKTLAGGGTMKMVNQTVRGALVNMGYSEEQVDQITKYIAEKGHVEEVPYLTEKQRVLFKCAASPLGDKGVIHWKDHVRMVAAIQTFVSGAISKTINMPENATVEDIEKVYMLGYDLGCKGITVYRNNCKGSAPLSVTENKGVMPGPDVIRGLSNEMIIEELVKRHGDNKITVEDILERLNVKQVEVEELKKGWGLRRRPGEYLAGFRHRIVIGQAQGYIKTFMYEDGRIAEVFVTFGNPGSSLSNVLECWSIAFSISLQRGEPLGKLCQKFINVEFEPKGFTGRRDDLKIVSSPVDYISRLLLKYFDEEGYIKNKEFLNFVTGETQEKASDEKAVEIRPVEKGGKGVFENRPFCPQCGARMEGGTNSCPSCEKCGYFGGCGG